MTNRIVTSRPIGNPDDMEAQYKRTKAFTIEKVVPALFEAAKAEEAGDDLSEVLNTAAFNTTGILFEPDPAFLIEAPMFPVRAFEIQTIRELARKYGVLREVPNLVVASGSATRIVELWGSMFITPKSHGFFPANLHLAEPHPLMTAQTMSERYSHLIPAHHVASTNQKAYGLRGIVLTDDSHQSIIQNYPAKSVDELLLLRFDPNSLTKTDSFSESTRGEGLFKLTIEALQTLSSMLSIVKENGHAIFSIGSGNDDFESLNRRILLSALKLCLNLSAAPYIEIHNPMANIMLKNGKKKSITELDLLYLSTLSSTQTLIIPGNAKLTQLNDLLQNASQNLFQVHPLLLKSIGTAIQRESLNDEWYMNLGLEISGLKTI